MCPVIMKASSSVLSFAAVPLYLTAVSSVLGKVFTNSRNRSGLLIVVFTALIALSTGEELKVLQDGTGLI